MFETKEFIEASRNWVVCRLDPYESKKHQEWVRKFLNGRFANTVFCLLAPDGEDMLSRAGRSPSQVFGTAQELYQEMDEVLGDHRARKMDEPALVPDFHSLDESINVASCDQRPLVLIVSETDAEEETLRERLRSVSSHASMLGRFHYDFAKAGADGLSDVSGARGPGIYLVESDKYGLSGKTLERFDTRASEAELLEALAPVGARFAEERKPKDYQAHVRAGSRDGIAFEQEIPPGEDRDGDGVPDAKAGGGGKSGKGGKGGKGKGQ